MPPNRGQEGWSRALVAGSALLLGSQVTVALVQFGYAAVVSRIVSPAGFGWYAIAMSAAALAGLLTVSGLVVAVARAPVLDEQVEGGMVALALVLGLLGAGATALLAPWWAALWGSPQAVDTVRWAALIVLVGPLAGVLTSLLRREGGFRPIALVTLVVGLLSLGLGCAATVVWRSAPSLLVPAIFTPALAVIALQIALGRVVRPRLRGVSVTRHAMFATKAVGANLIAYGVGNLPALTLGRVLGPGALGSFNRASVITAVPLQMLQTSALSTVYPEFRHDVNDSIRSRDLWPDLTLIMAWAVMPVAIAAAVLGPLVVPVLFGGNWAEATEMVPYLAIAAGLYAPAATLWNAIEATGHFRWLVAGQLVALAVTACGAVVSAATHSFVPVLVSMSLAALALHLVHIALTSRAGIIDVYRLVEGYRSLAGALLLWGLVLGVLRWTVTGSASAAIRLTVAVVALVVTTETMRRWLAGSPALQLLRRYHIVGRSGDV